MWPNGGGSLYIYVIPNREQVDTEVIKTASGLCKRRYAIFWHSKYTGSYTHHQMFHSDIQLTPLTIISQIPRSCVHITQ